MDIHQRRGLVGISFLDDTFTMVEVESAGGQYQINKIAQIPMNPPFDVTLHDDENSAARLAELINHALEDHGIMLQNAAFSLDSQMVLVKKSPIDSDLSVTEIREHVDWEVEQFVNEPREHFIVDFSDLGIQSQQNKKELLIVAVRKAIIDYVLKIFSQTKLNLKYIDVNIFAAMRAIRANYELHPGDKVALVDLGRNHLILSLVQGDDFMFSNELPFGNDREGGGNADLSDTDLARLIAKEMRRYILDYKLGEKIEDLDRVFLFGEKVNDNVLETLQNSYDVRIDKANPFRRIRFSSDARIDETEWARPETFVVCIGTALRDG